MMDGSEVDAQGFLQVKEGIRWRKRYTVLNTAKNKLFFFQGEQDKNEIGRCVSSVDFDKYRIMEVRYARDNFGYTRKADQWGFQVDTEEKSYQLLAPSEEEMEKWIDDLSRYKTTRDRDAIKEHKEHYGSYILTEDEIAKISSCYAPPLILQGLGFASIYEWTSGDEAWKSNGTVGAVCLVRHQKTNTTFVQIKDPANAETLLVEKLMPGSEYGEDSDYFHSFVQEGTQTRLGLSFSSVAEAKMFYDCVRDVMSAVPAGTSGIQPLQQLENLAFNLKTKLTSLTSSEPEPEFSISGPSDFRKGDLDPEIKAAMEGKFPATLPPMYAPRPKMTSEPSARFANVKDAIGGFMNRFKSSDSPLQVQDEDSGNFSGISGPTNVKREGHLGISKEGKLETELPKQWLEQYPQWKKFLLDIGIKEEELNDEKVVSEIMAEATNFIRQNNAPSLPKRATRRDMQDMVKEYRSTNTVESTEVAADIPSAPPPPPAEGAPRYVDKNPRQSVTAMNLLTVTTEDERRKLQGHLQQFMAKRRQDLLEEEEDDD